MNKALSTSKLVRNLLKSYGDVLRKNEIRDIIGLSGNKGYARVNNAVKDLVKTGEVERTGYGRYRWLKELPDAKYCKSQNKMWRFMWIRTKKSKPFTVRKVHEVCDVALYTATKYVTFLFKKNYLEKVGKKKAYKTNAPLYLIAPDKINTEVPVQRRRRETAEIEKCLDETRGLAAQYFRTADTRLETIRELLETARQINTVLENCEKIALGLRNKKK
jgi:hypothetical protein